MKESPYLPSLVRVMSIKPTGCKAWLIRLKTKISAVPGQFMVASISGEGEVALPLVSCRTAELLVIEEDLVTKSICNLKKGDKLGIRGPYGKGFPKEIMKKEWIFVAESQGLAYAKALCEQSLSERRQKREHILIAVQASIDDQIMGDPLGELSGRVNVTSISRSNLQESIKRLALSPEKACILLLPDSQDIASQFCTAGWKEEQLFISVPRKISCGTGRCGRCMVGSKHLCQDGPVFRYDQIRGML
jgi:NAD(P)H-flavin reductase